jgi:excisionase family DNA binding protein
MREIDSGKKNSFTKLHTVRETASLLQVSLSTVYSLVHSGKLPFISVGSKKGYRFSESDLQEFVSANRRIFEVKPTQHKRRDLKHLDLT